MTLPVPFKCGENPIFILSKDEPNIPTRCYIRSELKQALLESSKDPLTDKEFTSQAKNELCYGSGTAFLEKEERDNKISLIPLSEELANKLLTGSFRREDFKTVVLINKNLGRGFFGTVDQLGTLAIKKTVILQGDFLFETAAMRAFNRFPQQALGWGKACCVLSLYSVSFSEYGKVRMVIPLMKGNFRERVLNRSLDRLIQMNREYLASEAAGTILPGDLGKEFVALLDLLAVSDESLTADYLPTVRELQTKIPPTTPYTEKLLFGLDWLVRYSQQFFIQPVYELIKGLYLAAAVGVYHFDIKPENILVDDQPLDSNGERDYTKSGTVYMADWGMSKWGTGDLRLLYPVQTTPYRAPEVFVSGPELILGMNTDIWSLGVLIKEIWIDRVQYPTDQSAIRGIQKDYNLSNPLSKNSRGRLSTEALKRVPIQWREMIRKCLDLDPESRPTYAQLLNDPLFTQMRSREAAGQSFIQMEDEKEPRFIELTGSTQLAVLTHPPEKGIPSHSYLTAKMRRLVVDWLSDLFENKRGTPRGFFFTINILDRAVRKLAFPGNEFRGYGCACMYIAQGLLEQKEHQRFKPFVSYSDKAYTEKQLEEFVKTVCLALDFDFYFLDPYLEYNLRVNPAEPRVRNIKIFRYLMDPERFNKPYHPFSDFTETLSPEDLQFYTGVLGTKTDSWKQFYNVV